MEPYLALQIVVGVTLLFNLVIWAMDYKLFGVIAAIGFWIVYFATIIDIPLIENQVFVFIILGIASIISLIVASRRWGINSVEAQH